MDKSERVLLPGSVTPSHYALEITPNFTLLTYACSETIKVTVSEETSSITMHSKEIHILSATFEADEAAEGAVMPTLEGIAYNIKYHTVCLTFSGALPLGTGTLSLTFDGIMNGDMAGFYKCMYTDTAGNKKVMASTQFESLDARRAFPCWDEPAVKATFSVTLIVDQHLTAISNMPELSCTHLPDNKKKCVFDVSPKMSTYLLAWAIGEFDMVQATTKSGVVIRIFSPPGRAEQGRFALDCGVRALDFYDDFFQVPYPLPKLDMICITEFAMGAMENWGLVTYREVALMIDEQKASPQAKQRVAIVVAHELAHQWFGNLVTMEWWDNLWLNEGFAAWMEHFCIDSLYPEYRIWEQFTTDAFGAAQRLDALKTSHPILVPIRHADEVEQVFDAISYCKGSCVVNMVFALIGRDKFREGLQRYFSKHAYGNTSEEDLWAAWSEASGQNISDIMSVWITKMGYPYLRVLEESWSANSVTIKLEQNWFLADGSDESAASPVWQIPLIIDVSGSTTQVPVQIMAQKQQTFTLSLPSASSSIKINAGQKALCRVIHTPTMLEKLSANMTSLSAVDRAALLLDAYALAKAGLAPVEDTVTILRALANEESSIVWAAMASVLGGLNLLLETVSADASAAFKAFGKKIIVAGLAKVGWDSRPTDSHTDKLLRATVLALLDTFASKDESVLSEARRRFEGHFEDPSLLPSDYKTTVYKIVLEAGGLTEYEQVLKTYYATEDMQEKKYAMYTLGATSDRALKARTLEWAVNGGDVKLQDFFYPIGSVASNAEGSLMCWQYFQDNFALLKAKLAKASPSLMDAVIVNSINRFCTAEKADEIEEFFKTHPLPSSARRISQSVEVIRTNAAFLTHISRSKLVDPAFLA